MSTTLPFPSGGASAKSTGSHGDEMRIDIPKGGSKDEHRSKGGQNIHHVDANANAAPVVPQRGSSSAPVPPHWQHHPRPPHQTADSYFPHAGMHSGASSVASSVAGTTSTQQPRTPGSLRNHSRQTSAAGPISSAAPTSTRKVAPNMSLSLSSGGQGSGTTQNVANAPDSFADFAGGMGGHAGPPSPSTLTDIILGLHSTLYGAKRTAGEVREMVSRFYDRDAIFESPLLAASGREQIANQFIMAFTLPGLDVRSELRDVICSDFEFDGTRAGIIDQTLSVTFFPTLFGKNDSDHDTEANQPFNGSYAPPQSAHNEGSATPAYTLQSAITPHPFASYSQAHTPAGAGSVISRYASQTHSPTTPYSISSMWGASRPHTPGTTSSAIRPLSQTYRPSTPPSVNGEDESTDVPGQSTMTIQGHDEQQRYVTADESGGGQVSRPAMPEESLQPHWSHQGLGRSTVRAFLWGIFHPRAMLKHLCTINLRLMSRLEFNDAGLIVRHEDTWGVRETIEGVVPFASVLYALERRIVGYICSFAIGRGLRLSSALARHAIGPAAEKGQWGLENGGRFEGEQYDHQANEAARALLLGYHRHEKMQSMARSRASSPTRKRFSIHGPHTIGGYNRSRARSLIGGPNSSAPTRAASSDNLQAMAPYVMAGPATGPAYGERERGSTHGGETLPPDSSARYRHGSRRITTSTSSAPVGPIGLGASATGTSLDGLWQNGDLYGANLDQGVDQKTRAPDRDGH